MTNGDATTTKTSDTESDEQHFLFGMAKDRLFSRCLWGGIVLTLSPVVPYEEIDGAPQFLWQLLSELPSAAVIAAFAPCIVGVSLVVASRLVKRPASLAVWALAGLVSMTLLEKIGSDRARWSLVDLPSSLHGRPLLLIATLAGTGAGLRLVHRRDTRRLGRVVLATATLSGLMFYLLPSGAEAPLGTLLRVLASLPALPNFRFVLGALMLGWIAAYPLLVALAGGSLARWPPKREPRYLAPLATFGFPFLLGTLAFRSLLLTLGDASLIGMAGSIAFLAAVLGLWASTLEVLTPALANLVATLNPKTGGKESPPHSTPSPVGWSLGRSLTVALALVVVTSGVQIWLARPPEKGVNWKLSKRTPEADELFGKTVPKWSVARARWDQLARQQSSAESMVAFKANTRAMVQAARSLNPDLERTLKQLSLEGKNLDLAGRRWYRLVHEINGASQATGLPYYVDPTVVLSRTRDGLRRLFHLYTYGIESVHPVEVEGRAYATLHVRNLSGARDGHNLLGFSRDVQPFALVVLDEIEPYARELTELSRAEPPLCVASPPPGLAAPLTKCGKLLAEIAQRGPLEAPLIRLTERHELQHQMDGPLLPHARPVLVRLQGFTESAKDRVNRELSAYVAEVTTPGASPKLSLIHLFGFAMTGQRSTYAQTSVLAFEALSLRDLGGTVFATDRKQIAEAFAELVALSDDELRARAREAWSDLYGKNLPEIRSAE